jgi:excisionase family DNA binding protein
MPSGALRIEKSLAQRPAVSTRSVRAQALEPTRQVRESQEIREVMDIRQAALYLGISTDSLYRYASESVVPGFRLGNRWRFKKSRLDQWMDEKSNQSPKKQAGNPRQKKPVRSAS